MVLFRVVLLLSAATFPFSPTFAADGTSAGEWPQFRGYRARGVADRQNLPDSWDASTGSNVRWKTTSPGLGPASPIVTGGRVYIVTGGSGVSEATLRWGM